LSSFFNVDHKKNRAFTQEVNTRLIYLQIYFFSNYFAGAGATGAAGAAGASGALVAGAGAGAGAGASTLGAGAGSSAFCILLLKEIKKQRTA